MMLRRCLRGLSRQYSIRDYVYSQPRPLRAGEADPLRRLPEHLRKAESDLLDILRHRAAMVIVGSGDTF